MAFSLQEVLTATPLIKIFQVKCQGHFLCLTLCVCVCVCVCSCTCVTHGGHKLSLYTHDVGTRLPNWDQTQVSIM